MAKTAITPLPDPSGFSPNLPADILHSGACGLIEQAVEAELAVLLTYHVNEKTKDSRSRLMRHGDLPEREAMTGICPVPVKAPRVRGRADGTEKAQFTSSILPPYLRKAKSAEELLLFGPTSRAFLAAISKRC